MNLIPNGEVDFATLRPKIEAIKDMQGLITFLDYHPGCLPKYTAYIDKAMVENRLWTYSVPLIELFIERIVSSNFGSDDYAILFENYASRYLIHNKYDSTTLNDRDLTYHALLHLCGKYTHSQYPDIESLAKQIPECDSIVFERICMLYLNMEFSMMNPYLLANKIAYNFKFTQIANARPVEFRAMISPLFSDEEGYTLEEKEEFITNGIDLMIRLKNHVSETGNDDTKRLAIYLRSFIQNEDTRNLLRNRYEKYFGHDTIVYATDLYMIMDTHNGSNDRQNLYANILAYAKMMMDQHALNNVTFPIIKCFIHDINSTCYSIHHQITCKEFIDTLNEINKLDKIPTNDPNILKLTDEYEGRYEESNDYETEAPKSHPSYVVDLTATEARDRKSSIMHKVENKVYGAYRNYKDQEAKIDSQATKLVQSMKKVAVGDVRDEIIEGKKMTVIGCLKKLLGTAALFSFGPVKAAIALVVRHAYRKKATDAERRKLVMDLNEEIEIINEKIDDAKGDGNRKAKYQMMRTRSELIRARNRIQAGIANDPSTSEAIKGSMAEKKG